jgi:hypothetical protein
MTLWKSFKTGTPGDQVSQSSTPHVHPHSPEFQAKAWAIFDGMIDAERKRKEQFGEQLPIMHVEAWGKRLVGVGNRIYSVDPKAGSQDFLRDYLRDTLGDAWWKNELSKPVIARHRVAQWQAHAEELMRGETPDELGRYLIPNDGRLIAYVTLAHDLFIIKQNTRFQENIIERLRNHNDFAGVRYELLVAATFVRAGFSVEPEDESDGSKRHPEFVATHRASGFVVAVEAKARNRAGTTTPTTAGVYDHVQDAAGKAPKDKPFALFVDVAMPPKDPTADRPTWFEEVDGTVRTVVDKNGGYPGPFDSVFFTNITYQYGTTGEPLPPHDWVVWTPRKSRMPMQIQSLLVAALQKHAAIPEFETDS